MTTGIHAVCFLYVSGAADNNISLPDVVLNDCPARLTVTKPWYEGSSTTLATYVVSFPPGLLTSYTLATLPAPGELAVVTVRSAACHCTGTVVGQVMAMAVVLSVVTAAVVLPTELWYPMLTAYRQQSTAPGVGT